MIQGQPTKFEDANSKQSSTLKEVNDQDNASTASSGSGTGRLHIIEGLRRQDSRIAKYKKLYSDLSRKFITLYEELQTCQQQQRLDEELSKARSTQHALLDEAITNALKQLGQATSRNAVPVMKHVMSNLEAAKTASSQMQAIPAFVAGQDMSAANSAVIASVLFAKSKPLNYGTGRSALLEEAPQINPQSSMQLHAQSLSSVVLNRGDVDATLLQKRSLGSTNAAISSIKKADTTSSIVSGMRATMRPPSPLLHVSEVDSRHSGKITKKKG